MPQKYIYDYSGLNFKEIEDLTIVEFKMLLRDAFIYRMEQTLDGRAYLEDCWTMEQTEPDRETLRSTFGHEA